MYTNPSKVFTDDLIDDPKPVNILSYQRFNPLCDIEFPKAGMWTRMI